MENNKLLVIELKKAIKEEIGECDPRVWGKLCQMRSTEKGYQTIEKSVIRLVCEEGMTIGSALAFIESELEHEKD